MTEDTLCRLEVLNCLGDCKKLCNGCSWQEPESVVMKKKREREEFRKRLNRRTGRVYENY